MKRGKEEKQIFSFDQPAVTITQTHVTSKKPKGDRFQAHPQDAASLDEAQELTWDDFAKLTTAQEHFRVPPTVRMRDAALVLQEFTLPPMLREVLHLLQIRTAPRRPATQSNKTE